jgi:N-acetylglutamate synthase-like GNAT family acetyltransferase
MSDHDEIRRIRNAASGDWPAIRSLLLGAGLPVADLNAAAVGRFLPETVNDGDGERIVGAAGLEVYDSAGLLRSLVVDQSRRGKGCGSRLADAIEHMAGQAGVTELWLLTIDADGFFVSRGYRAVSRDVAPSAIRATAEFSSLCPDSAVLMPKALR